MDGHDGQESGPDPDAGLLSPRPRLHPQLVWQIQTHSLQVEPQDRWGLMGLPGSFGV